MLPPPFLHSVGAPVSCSSGSLGGFQVYYSYPVLEVSKAYMSALPTRQWRFWKSRIVLSACSYNTQCRLSTLLIGWLLINHGSFSKEENVDQDLANQNVALGAAPESPGFVRGAEYGGHPRIAEPCLPCTKTSRWFVCTFKFEKPGLLVMLQLHRSRGICFSLRWLDLILVEQIVSFIGEWHSLEVVSRD